MDDKQPHGRSDDDRLALARKRFRLAADSESALREKMLDDLRFRAGQQWPESIERERMLDGRPCLTINRLPQFIRQVTSEQQEKPTAIQIGPVGDGADEDTAEILQGLIRTIERNSDADVAYETAAEHAATMGRGWIRILSDYEDPMSFDQVLKIDRIRNPFRVYCDPSAERHDRSDMRWLIYVDDVPRDVFEEEHPDSELAGLKDFSGLGDDMEDWATEDAIRIAEYFYTEKKKKTIVKLADGKSILSDKMKGIEQPAQRPDGKPITRETMLTVVIWSKITGTEILEERELPGPYIPWVPVLGDEIDIDGQIDLAGIVRYAKDPQRMLNYWASAETETIALAPRSPFIIAEGQDDGYQDMWAQANRRNYSRLIYKPKAVNGELAPPPQRNMAEPPVQAISLARKQSEDDLKGTTGIYDASLGAQGNETSGKAILARKNQGAMANLHYSVNKGRAIRQVGRILVSWIPAIYDVARILRITEADGQTREVQVNQQFADPKDGAQKIFDLRVGKYDVSVAAGPSYATKRQEAAESMLQLVQAFPPLMQFAGDLLVRNMDWPGAEEIADRLKKMLPPPLQDQEEGEQQIPPQIQAQMAQMQQSTQLMMQELQQAQQIIQSKQIENDARVKIAEIQAETQRYVAKLTNEVKFATSKIENFAAIQQTHAEFEAEAQQQVIEHAHERDLAQQDAQLQQQQQQQQQGHEAGMAQQQQNAQAQQQQSAQQAQADLQAQQQQAPEPTTP